MPRIPSTNATTIRDLRRHGRGRVLVVVATGPSVNEVADLALLKTAERVDTLAINRAHPAIDPPSFLLLQDSNVRAQLDDSGYLASYPGLILSALRASPGDQLNTVFFPLIQGLGWSRDLASGWVVGKSSTYAALQVGAWMDYAKVYVLGCDMSAPAGRLYHHDGPPERGADDRIGRFNLEARHFDHAAAVLAPHERARFYFCSAHNPYAFVRAFNRRDHRGIVGEILRAAEALQGATT